MQTEEKATATVSASAGLEFDGACHCGTVTFHVKLAGSDTKRVPGDGPGHGLDSARRCDCSFCRMRGAVAVTAAKGDLTVLTGADALTLYRFNTKVAQHYFCSVCGIYTHHVRRSNPEQLGVNVACLDGLSPFDFACVPVSNGIAHPTDNPGAPGASGVVGWVRFEKAG